MEQWRPSKPVSLSDNNFGMVDKSVKMDIRPTIVLLSSRADPEDNESGGARRTRRGSLVSDGLYSTHLMTC